MSFKAGDKVFYFATGRSLLFTALWFCLVWGFFGQMNPDFFFSEHSWPFLLSSFPPHEMILSPPEDFPPCLQGFSKRLHFNDE